MRARRPVPIRMPHQRLALLALAVAAATLLGACSGGGSLGGVPSGLDRADWLGVWRGQEPDVVGTADVETTLQPDGTFSSLAKSARAGTVTRMWGDWAVRSGDPALLRFTIKGHDPKQFCGPLGCTPVLAPAGVTWAFRFIDRNTVALRGSDCASASCEVTYRRA